MTSLTRFNIFNAVFFQIGWFVCVLYGDLWAGLFTLVTLFAHFLFSSLRKQDLIAILIAVVIGLAHDAVLIGFNLLEFSHTQLSSPVWVICVWILLGINLNHSLKWVYQRPWIGGALGALCGPLSYLAGARLSPLADWTASLYAVVPVLAFMWALVLPIHKFLSRLISQKVIPNAVQTS